MSRGPTAAVAAAAKGSSGPFVAVARIVRAQGRRGEVLADLLTDFPERFSALRCAFLGQERGSPEPVEIERAWPHKGRVVLKFAGVDSIGDAERLRGLHVLIPNEERVPLPAYCYYIWELEGCQVIQQSEGVSQPVGIVSGVAPTGGVDVLRVRRPEGRGEVLIPLAQAICTRIDVRAKTIVIDPPEDLLGVND